MFIIRLILPALSLFLCTNTLAEITSPDAASMPAIASDVNPLDALNQQVQTLQQQVENLQARVLELEQRPQVTRIFKSRMDTVLHHTQPVSGSHSSPTSINSILATAQQYYKRGNFRAAANALREADSGGDGSEVARKSMYLLLQSHQRLGNCQSVINIGQRYVSRFSDSQNAPEALYAIGQCQWQIQQQDIARETWRNLLHSYPKSIAARRAATRLK